jgi:hypothetical protein
MVSSEIPVFKYKLWATHTYIYIYIYIYLNEQSMDINNFRPNSEINGSKRDKRFLF